MEKVEQLKKLTQPILDFLKENYNPHTTIIINIENIKVVTDEINIPISKF